MLEEEREITTELRNNVDRAERQCDAAKDELEEFKKLQKFSMLVLLYSFLEQFDVK